ncbi:hypothetical protein KIPB_011432 [Kipferlia bialata]|uniref:Uncharacterized protein n=1 Tax=Kipferlia bialata TaxID=797122 RepID=A0A9K3D4P8_9EUKA|nr:hypothetical protein KIPB_011432 [Kipferlia bialata]|eukprot:g11432.t1
MRPSPMNTTNLDMFTTETEAPATRGKKDKEPDTPEAGLHWHKMAGMSSTHIPEGSYEDGPSLPVSSPQRRRYTEIPPEPPIKTEDLYTPPAAEAGPVSVSVFTEPEQEKEMGRVSGLSGYMSEQVFREDSVARHETPGRPVNPTPARMTLSGGTQDLDVTESQRERAVTPEMVYDPTMTSYRTPPVADQLKSVELREPPRSDYREGPSLAPPMGARQGKALIARLLD